mmetsp:Transcript_33551/g.45918  ORF Transcript_33551/g.45918 Transcript_33551/m.45918 type:complete len:144 (+) Transcript_33551:54-485(+)|eukprot:CAMPEP_0201486406 /NCGR_PEP_ID=MMETSP0151_2-20130828/10471_1 /ASSEMBLY_ACC=CAM_ASM_000257 /TAXON_ID=200890 /ORGANISM="Paramoeba atlantica, Strain 621/1 / CCAP 1560/9" /LENGTH=143 /DNA_ID=CAMNT_0047871025 /DNA_START=26 /DNA_END=457 /DNA_ORIENTATION=+
MSGYIIDKRNIYKEIGKEKFETLVNNFYERVFGDVAHPLFHAQFLSQSKAESIQNLSEFLIQRMGGPALFTTRKSQDQFRGHPALRARHRHFVINTETAKRWLYHMKNAMIEVELDPSVKDSAGEAMWEFFEDSAMFLRNQED